MGYCLNPRNSLGSTGEEVYPIRMARQAIDSFHYIQAAIYDSNEEIFVSRYRFLENIHTDKNSARTSRGFSGLLTTRTLMLYLSFTM